MKINKLLLLLLIFVLISSCSQLKIQIDEIEIIYNSKKFNGKKYDVSISPKVSLINNSNKNIAFNIRDIDTLQILINNTNYDMSIIDDSLKPKMELSPNEKLIVYYKTDYHKISEGFDNNMIADEIVKSLILNKEKSVIEKASNFTVKPRIQAYIKKTYYTPNGTKIEEIGD